MTKVYTKTGDRGTTSLIGGERVSKCDVRVEAYGTVDELTAFLALLADNMRETGGEAMQHYIHSIEKINSTLMSVEAHLAAGDESRKELPQITEGAIEYLETEIDTMQSELPPITNFTIPGGCRLNSLSHVCRTVCRRAERCAILVSESHPMGERVITYLNRLSDYLYLLGRRLSQLSHSEEILWTPQVD